MMNTNNHIVQANKKSKALCAARMSGVTMIEYGLIAALVGVAAIASLTLLGTNLNTKFNTIAGNITSA